VWVVELEKDNGALRLLRLHDREPWVFLSDEHARVVRALGDRADELASRPTLVSTGEVRRAFAEQVQGTVLVTAKEERLFALAAAASTRAAASARLEIYPRGLEPKRALELCAATFKGGVTEDDVRARVALRYPEAAPLPPRPELDGLLAGLGFSWTEGGERGWVLYPRGRGRAHVPRHAEHLHRASHAHGAPAPAPRDGRAGHRRAGSSTSASNTPSR
jgi:hypothetical protein